MWNEENPVRKSTCKQCKSEFEKKNVEVKPVSDKQFSYHKSKLHEKVKCYSISGNFVFKEPGCVGQREICQV